MKTNTWYDHSSKKLVVTVCSIDFAAHPQRVEQLQEERIQQVQIYQAEFKATEAQINELQKNRRDIANRMDLFQLMVEKLPPSMEVHLDVV